MCFCVCYLPSCRLSVKPYSGFCWNVMFTPTSGVPSGANTRPLITHTWLEKKQWPHNHNKNHARLTQVLPQSYLSGYHRVTPELPHNYFWVMSRFSQLPQDYSVITSDFTLESPQSYPQNYCSHLHYLSYHRITTQLPLNHFSSLELPQNYHNITSKSPKLPQNYHRVTSELPELPRSTLQLPKLL